MPPESFYTQKLLSKVAVIQDNDRNIWGDMVGIYFARVGEDGRLWPAKPLEFSEPAENGFPTSSPPMLEICHKEPGGKAVLQRMMDDLWAMGLRPTGVSTPNEVAAVERHLQDVRALLANQLEMTLPGLAGQKPRPE